MLKISSLKKLVTDQMAIDLGTANTIIAVKGRGVVLDEPSLVAINELTEEIIAFGDRLLAAVRLRAHGGDSGFVLDQLIFQLFTLNRGW